MIKADLASSMTAISAYKIFLLYVFDFFMYQIKLLIKIFFDHFLFCQKITRVTIVFTIFPAIAMKNIRKMHG